MRLVDRPEDPAREAALWQRWRESGDAPSREALIRRHLPYARVVAASFYARRTRDDVEFAEYLQFASLGLVESVDRYDPAGGAQFRTFAARRMQGAILDGLVRLTEMQSQIAARQRARRDRLASLAQRAGDASAAPADALASRADRLFGDLAEIGIGLALGCLLDGTGMLDDPRQPALAEPYDRPLELRQLRERVRELIPQLSEAERVVVRWHYLQEHGFEAIAARLGVSKGRVSQIHREALASLRRQLDARTRCDIAW